MKSLFSCLLKGHTLCAFGFLSLSSWCKQIWGCQCSPTDTMLYTQQTLVISLGQNLKLTQCLTFSELCCVPKYGQYYAMLCYDGSLGWTPLPKTHWELSQCKQAVNPTKLIWANSWAHPPCAPKSQTFLGLNKFSQKHVLSCSMNPIFSGVFMNNNILLSPN
jgi:hypothetical protein